MKHRFTAPLFAAATAFACAAQAADLPWPVAPPRSPALPVFTWVGVSAGVNAGYATDSGRGFTDTGSGGVTGGRRSGGFAGGGQTGYDDRFTPGSGFVTGVEADIRDLSNSKADAAYIGATPYHGIRPNLDDFGTVRGRIGYAFDRVLIYGTGGFASGGGSRSAYAATYPDRLAAGVDLRKLLAHAATSSP